MTQLSNNPGLGRVQTVVVLDKIRSGVDGFNMVCISCIVVPLFLYIWHKFLQPIALKIWNPWGKVEDKSKDGVGEDDKANSTESESKSNGTAIPATGKGKTD